MTTPLTHPVSILQHLIRWDEKYAAKLDTWTKDPANDEADDWEYQYQEYRKTLARIRRRKAAALRIHAAREGSTPAIAAALAALRGFTWKA